MSRPLAIASIVGTAMMLESCNDALLHEAAPAAAPVTISASVSSSSRSNGAAYDRADRIFVRFRVGDQVRLERELPFTPAPTVRVRVDVPLRAPTETMNADVELRIGDRALFRGGGTAALSSGVQGPLDLPLVPVISSVSCGTGPLQLSSYGQTAQLTGAALFATGDTLDNTPVTFSTTANTVASVTETGAVAALQDGSAVATCTAGGVSGTRQIQVFGVVNRVQLAPATATLVTGRTLAYKPTLFDARGNEIKTERAVAFSSSNAGVATVNGSGVASAVTAGSVQINASSGGISGNATLVVVPPSTAVTIASTGVTGNSATLLGSVNPRGVSTQAWFEWGTDPSLAVPTVSSTQPVGSGSVDVSVTTTLGGLQPNTTYYFRVVASNVGGPARGSALSFTTPAPPVPTTTGLSPLYPTGYVMSGSVIPSGNATEAWFEYSTSAALATPLQTSTQGMGSGTSSVPILWWLPSLQPFTTYYARVVARSIGGTIPGNIVSFSTGGAPTITSTGVDRTKANCRSIPAFAVVNPNGIATYVWFQYGSSSTFATYSTTTTTTISGTAAGRSDVIIPLAGTTYLRGVTSNYFGTQYGFVFSADSYPCVN